MAGQIVLPRVVVPSGRWPTHGEGARNRMPCTFNLRRLAAKVKEGIRNLLGVLSDRSLVALVVFAVSIQLAATRAGGDGTARPGRPHPRHRVRVCDGPCTL